MDDIRELNKLLSDEFDRIFLLIRELDGIVSNDSLDDTVETLKLIQYDELFEEKDLYQSAVLTVVKNAQDHVLYINKSIAGVGKYLVDWSNNILKFKSTQNKSFNHTEMFVDTELMKLMAVFYLFKIILRECPEQFKAKDFDNARRYLINVVRRSSMTNLPDYFSFFEDRFSENQVVLHEYIEIMQGILMEHRDICHEWDIENDMAAKYFNANIILLRCLDVASVVDRHIVKNTVCLIDD